MAEGDKDRSGYLMKGELMIVLHRYKKYVEEQPDVVRPVAQRFDGWLSMDDWPDPPSPSLPPSSLFLSKIRLR